MSLLLSQPIGCNSVRAHRCVADLPAPSSRTCTDSTRQARASLRRIAAAIAFLSILLHDDSAFAQPSSQTAVPDADEHAANGATADAVLPAVNVTATRANKRASAGTKTDTAVIETPQSISIIDAKRIAAIGALTAEQALGYTPGVGITHYGSDSRFNWIVLRGFDAYSPGFYLDGLPLRNNGTWGVWQTENYGTEQIEVLRGPASVLYGQTGPGGVINVVSKKPEETPLHEVQFQLGSYDRRQIAGDFSGPLNADHSLLYRVTGLARNAELPAGGMPDNRYFLAPALTWRPTEDTTLSLLSSFTRVHAGVYNRFFPQSGTLVPTPIGTKIPTSLFAGDPHFNRFDQDQQLIGYQFEHRFNETWSVRQNLRYGHLKLRYAQLWGPQFATLNADDPLDPINFRYLSRTVFGSRENTAALALDNQIEGDLALGEWQHKLLFGLDYQRLRLDQTTVYGGTAPLLDIYAPVYGGPIVPSAPYVDGITRLSQTGLYVQDQIRWNERWLLTLGGRFDRASSVLDSRLDGTTTRFPDHKFSSRAGLLYVTPGGWAPYFSYTESFSPTATIDPRTGIPFKPETGRQYEAGIRYQPPGRNETYSAAVFDVRRQNYITSDQQFIPRQTGEVGVRGLELEANVELIPRLNFTAAYTYTQRAVITASSNPAEIGKQLMAVPRNALSLWADYAFDNGFRAGLGARYGSSTRGDGATAPIPIPAATVFDAMLGYRLERWDFALNLRNLANKTYLTNCGYGTCYYADRRTTIATASYRW